MRLDLALASGLLIVLLGGLIACGQPGASDNAASASDAAETVKSRGDDASLQQASDQARGSLDTFWKAWDRRRPTDDAFRLNVGFPARGGGTENIWVALTSRDGDSAVGKLSNDPVYFVGKMGDEVKFDVSAVQDWTFRRDGKMYGMFSTRVLLRRVSPAQAARVSAVLSETPLPDAER